MVYTKLSEVGGKVIIGDEQDEIILPALADGTSKAGHLVTILSTGYVDNTDTDNPNEFVGILLPHYSIDVDTAITSGLPVNVVVPRSGHLYAFYTLDMNASDAGHPGTFSGTEGVGSAVITDIEATANWRTYRYDDGDTVGIFIWGV